MKKKLLSLALALMLALTLLPTAVFAEDPVDPIPEQSIDQSTPAPDLDKNPEDSEDSEKQKGPENSNNLENPDDKGGSDDSTKQTVPTADENTDKTGGTDKTTDTDKTGDPADDPTTDPTDDPAPHVHSIIVVQEVPATCQDPGTRLHYKCSDPSCGKLFSDPEGTQVISAPVQIPVTSTHTLPDSPSFAAGDVDESQHYYTCKVCGNRVSGLHSFNSSNVCTVCGFTRTAPSSPHRYVDITSVYLNSYSIDVTWYSDEPAGTYFDVYVDGSLRDTVAPSRSSSGHFSYTANFSRYLSSRYYNVTVYLHDDTSHYDTYRVYNRDYDYDYDYDYWYDHSYRPNGTPGTNSSGIPYASQVNGRYSASEAIRILRNSNQNSLQYDLLHSNTASNSFSDLEAAVKRHNRVDVFVNVDRSDVPSAIRNIQILGAAFNASSTNSTVRLEVDAPSQTRYAGYGYQFSMSLTGVGNDSSLDVPVKVTMSVPSGIRSSSVRILHFHNSSVPDVIDPVVSGSSMSFTLTGFSDFVITDDRIDPYYYYYAPAVPAAARRSLIDEHLAIALPILASMSANGYIYDDVPPTYWAAAEIAWARDGGMMSGYYDGTFRPYSSTTRQELWMVLGRLAGANPADMWAARQWAMSAGISDGQYPHSTLSRQQMIAMLYRYAQYLGKDVSAQANLQGCQDVSMISGYARNAMAWAVDQGIITFDASGCLHPQDIATRADFAVYLFRFIN